jgi:hypothetical protein
MRDWTRDRRAGLGRTFGASRSSPRAAQLFAPGRRIPDEAVAVIVEISRPVR